MKKKTLITTAIDYTNDEIHVGHAYEKILADFFARYERLKKGVENVGFITGTDEHGTTNEKAAKEKGISTLEHVTEIAKKNKKQLDTLNISYDRFIRTTDEDHKKIAVEIFQKSFDNGFIYKDTYEGLYCEGCEAHKTLSDLDEHGKCHLHPTREIQKHEEENYFFKWSEFSDFLEKLVSSDTFVLPEGKRKEMLAFIRQGIEDIPITRPKFKLPWGITTPIDEEQVIYVWYDALINYYTFGSQNDLWDKDTKIVHFVGKDIARWHALLWPAMLKSAEINLPDTVYVHGFINLNGQKISKSTGNIIKPDELVNKYGVDAVRYYFLKYGPITEDVNISIEHFENVYNGELANGLGNTVARLAKLAERSGSSFKIEGRDPVKEKGVWENVEKNFRADLSLQKIWHKLSDLDKHINDNEPWKIEDEKELEKILGIELEELYSIAQLLAPFIPETSEKIIKQLSNGTVKFEKALFPRLD